MEGRSFGGERQWRPAVWSSIRPGLGSIELVEGRDRCGAKLGSSGLEGFERGSEERLEGRASALCSCSARASSRKGMKGMEGKGREACRACARIRAAHGGRGSPGCSTRGVAGGTVAGMGAGVGKAEQNRNFRFPTRNFRFPNPEPPGFGQNRFNFGAPKTKIFAQQLEIWPK